MSPANFDWLYFIGGAVLGLAAAILGLRALFRDRPRGRRRCPGCWYDMSGVPGLRCPECGREARGERRLLRTRRRWKQAGLAALLGAIACGVAAVPRYQKGGWVGLVPSSVLVYIAPLNTTPAWTAGAGATGAGASIIRSSGGVVIVQAPGFVPPPMSRSQQLNTEVWARLHNGDLAQWQSQVFLRRVLTSQPQDLAEKLQLPAKWAVGEPIPARFNPPAVERLEVIVSDPGQVPSSGPAAWFRPRTSSAESIRLELGLRRAGKRVYHESRDIPIRIEGTRETLLDRLSSDKDTALVKEALDPHLASFRGTPVLITYDRSDRPVWMRIDFSIHYTFELREGPTLLGRGHGHTEWNTMVWKAWDEAQVEWQPGGKEAFTRADAHLSITVRGEPAEAIRSYIAWPFDKPRAACWTGEFSVDLDRREHPGLVPRKN